MPGVIRTRVGYCGGTTRNPTYDNIGDHLETIQIDFDPAVISYTKLLKVFWETHDPCRRPFARQYTSAIFFHNRKQREAALATLAAEKKKRRPDVLTEVLPLAPFYLAEDYHQKFYLQENRTLKSHFRRLYPDLRDFIHSTAAARVNGYVGWNGTKENFRREIDSLGLPPAVRRELEDRASHLK